MSELREQIELELAQIQELVAQTERLLLIAQQIDNSDYLTM